MNSRRFHGIMMMLSALVIAGVIGLLVYTWMTSMRR
jgi:hypothetical protein